MNFKYPYYNSRSRENYLVDFLEREEVKMVLQTRAILDTLLATSNVLSPEHKQKAFETAMSNTKEYIQIALPSTTQKGKIDNIKSIDKSELKAIKDRLSLGKSKK